MTSLIIVEPPAIWGKKIGKGTKRVAFNLAIFEQVVSVRAACWGKKSCILYSGLRATVIAQAAGVDLVRLEWHFGAKRRIAAAWQAVQEAIAAEVEVVVLIDPVANIIVERFVGTRRQFTFSPGEVVKISEAGEVTKLVSSPG
ncbi:MAG: hypothetical protein AAB943_01730 [Patescibacteria group bacterium]